MSSQTDKWEANRHDIAKWYVDDQESHGDIARRLALKGLHIGAEAVKSHLRQWQVRRIKKPHGLQLLAQCLAYNRSIGREVAFFRFGEPLPINEAQAYLEAHPKLDLVNMPLPGHLSLVLPEDTSNARPSNSDSINVATASNHADTAAAQTADHGQSKKRKLAELPARARRSPQQTRIHRRSRQPPSSDEESGDESEAEGQPASEVVLGKLDEAASSLVKLPRDLGLSESVVNKSLGELRGLLKLARSAIRRNRNRELFTDLGPLHCAAREDNEEIVALLLANEDIEVNAKGGAGFTALHLAAYEASFKAMQALLLHPEIDIDACDDGGLTPLVLAINSRNKDAVRCSLLLIERGADVDKDLPCQTSVLHQACRIKDMELVIPRIIANTKRINAQDDSGHTALHIAIGLKHWKYAEALINAGADLNIQAEVDDFTPLHTACVHASESFLLAMVARADADCTISAEGGRTALHLLCQRELCAVSEAVLQKPGVNINAQQTDGVTPLIVAAENGAFDTVKMLLYHKADPGITHEMGDTALTIAITRKHTKIAKLLIESGSPLNPHYKTRAYHKAAFMTTRIAQEMSSIAARMVQRSRNQANDGTNSARRSNAFDGPQQSRRGQQSSAADSTNLQALQAENAHLRQLIGSNSNLFPANGSVMNNDQSSFPSQWDWHSLPALNYSSWPSNFPLADTDVPMQQYGYFDASDMGRAPGL
nr:hypothetical protein B0A51_00361 [Rachicladosporium sp. CCFEE 5018]